MKFFQFVLNDNVIYKMHASLIDMYVTSRNVMMDGEKNLIMKRESKLSPNSSIRM